MCISSCVYFDGNEKEEERSISIFIFVYAFFLVLSQQVSESHSYFSSIQYRLSPIMWRIPVFFVASTVCVLVRLIFRFRSFPHRVSFTVCELLALFFPTFRSLWGALTETFESEFFYSSVYSFCCQQQQFAHTHIERYVTKKINFRSIKPPCLIRHAYVCECCVCLGADDDGRHMT